MPRVPGSDDRSRVLDRRVLNRTLLVRQSLLEREDLAPITMIERLVGQQAQEPQDPFVGLWSRIRAFDPGSISDGLGSRTLVRIGLMRTTLHLVSTADALGLAPVMDTVHRRVFRSTAVAKALVGLDLEAVIQSARDALEASPVTPSDLGRRLAQSWPERDPTALSNVARYHLSLVQVPPRGLWRRTGRATNTTLESWAGEALRPATLADIVRRYLLAFGPATVADIRTWSSLTGLRETVEGMRDHLTTYRDDRGRELFDVPGAMIAEPDLVAPVRFLPQYDNVFLSHDDRARIHGDTVGQAGGADFGWKGPVLVDGFIAAAWRVRRAHGRATMTIDLVRPVSRVERRDLEEEADRLGSFLDPDLEREIILVPTFS